MLQLPFCLPPSLNFGNGTTRSWHRNRSRCRSKGSTSNHELIASKSSNFKAGIADLGTHWELANFEGFTDIAFDQIAPIHCEPEPGTSTLFAYEVQLKRARCHSRSNFPSASGMSTATAPGWKSSGLAQTASRLWIGSAALDSGFFSHQIERKQHF